MRDAFNTICTVPPPIEAHELSVTVDGRAVLCDLSFVLPRNGVTVVMGPNGAGKSMLLRALHGLQPFEGKLLADGAPFGPAAQRTQALVFQKPVLLRRSVAANVDFALSTRGRKDAVWREHLLAQVGLAGMGARPARRLSGGEQQRLALARALATRPKLLFLDEPTANLDPAATARIEQVVAEVAATGVKVVFVTHDIGQARRIADDVLFLHAGKLVEQSRADSFFDVPRTAEAQRFLQGHLLA